MPMAINFGSMQLGDGNIQLGASFHKVIRFFDHMVMQTFQLLHHYHHKAYGHKTWESGHFLQETSTH